MEPLRCLARLCLTGLAVSGAAALLQATVWAQTSITTDSSWGRTPANLAPSASATTVLGNRGSAHSIPGNVYTIAESQGRLAGANLFHSFQRFNVGSGDAAVFTTTTPTLNNVISRVSGSSATQINGLLALVPQRGGAPDFFFINPAGVTFGAGAQVDVPAALHVSTANRLSFADGTIFKAGDGSDSSLSIAAPEAFGFLGTTRAPIVASGDDGDLITTAGAALSLVGGDVLIDQTLVATLGGSELRVAAVGADAVDVPIAGPLPPAQGTLAIANAGGLLAIDLQAQAGGRIDVSAGDIFIDGQGRDSFTGILTQASYWGSGGIAMSAVHALHVLNGGAISSETYSIEAGGGVRLTAPAILVDAGTVSTVSFAGGGDIDMEATDSMFIRNGSSVSSLVFGPGDSGTVSLSSGGLFSLLSGSRVSTSSLNVGYGGGNTGPIVVDAGRVLIDGAGSSSDTALFSQTAPGTFGSAGDILLRARENIAVQNGAVVVSLTRSFGGSGSVAVSAGGDVSVLNGAEITTYNVGFGAGEAGAIRIAAESMTIDGMGSSGDTGVSSQSNPDAFGAAGDIDLSIRSAVAIRDGGLVVSSTESFFDSGVVRIAATDVHIDGEASEFFTGVSTATLDDSYGNAGPITIAVTGILSVVNGALISSDSYGAGNSGPITIRATDVVLDGGNSPETVDILGGSAQTGIATAVHTAGSPGAAGSILIDARGELEVARFAAVRSRTSGAGGAGDVTTNSANLRIDQAAIRSSTFAMGDAGHLHVATAGDIVISNGGEIHSVTFGSGDAGTVSVGAQGGLFILNGGQIASAALSAEGSAGSIEVGARELTLDGPGGAAMSIIVSLTAASGGSSGDVVVDVEGALTMTGGQISSRTFAGGSGADVKVQAGSIAIIGQGDHFTGIFSDSQGEMAGDAGRIEVTADQLSMVNGALISADTFSTGRAGSIDVSAKRVFLDGRGSASATRISSGSSDLATGDAGDVTVSVSETLSLIDAEISSDTFSTGAAGNVVVRVAGDAALTSGGQISSSSVSLGPAGNVTLTAWNVKMDGQFNQTANTGVLAFNGGDVVVSAAGQLSLLRNAVIAASTLSAVGGSGSVTVHAGDVLVDQLSGINAAAGKGSSGRSGSLLVTADRSIVVARGSSLSIRNDARVDDPGDLASTLLTVSAPIIQVVDSRITAESTGNVAASDIEISFTDRLVVDPSRITTSANEGDGGDIRILGGNLLWLDHSQITTSVLGASGDGGDIVIRAGTLLMETGFIQANTAGTGGRGGNVTIDVRTLLASGGTLLVGGSTPAVFDPNAFGLNVIQAAAPDGVSGLIGIAAPVLDIAGELSGLEAEVLDLGPLGRDLCRVGAGSSLTPVGRGGLRPSAAGLIRPEGQIAQAAAARDGGETRQAFGATHPQLAAACW